MKLEKHNLHVIGYVHSVQGVRGQLFVVIQADDLPWIDNWRDLILSQSELSHNYSSFQIKEKKSHHKQGKQGFIVTLEKVADREQAEMLKGYVVSIPKEYVISQKGENIFLHEILHFQVIDKVRGVVGEIISVESGGIQDLIQIKTATDSYDVPLVEEFIENIDFEAKKIFMDVPQGLLEEL